MPVIRFSCFSCASWRLVQMAQSGSERAGAVSLARVVNKENSV